MKYTQSTILSMFMVVVGIIISGSIVVHAQESTVVFPVAELGNCANKAACMQFCAQKENRVACTNFGQAHNLISKEDAEKAKKFEDVLKGNGPGGCTDEITCKSYCDDVAHLDECTSFAERHGLVNAAQLDEMKKISGALKAGATMPGGCKNKAECESYCSDASHADECLAFAEKSGHMNPNELAQAKKMVGFIKNKETPGGCTSKDQCEQYCANNAHFDECIAFADKAGLMPKEDIAIARKVGGKGPGGCTSKEACDAYCNMPEHADACMQFAEQKGILSSEKVQEIKQGMGYLRTGLNQAPEEVKTCLRQNLGDNVIGKIESGTLTPTQQVGETVKTCFANQLPKIKAKMEEGLKYATPEVTQCLNDKVGQDELTKIKAGEAPSPDKALELKSCFELLQKQGAAQMRGALPQLPPEAKKCLVEKLGADMVEKIASGADVAATPEMGAAMKECATSAAGGIQQQMQSQMQQLPPSVQTCIKSKIGDTSNMKGAPANIQSVVEECMKTSLTPEGYPRAEVGPVTPGRMPPTTIPSFPPGAEDCMKKVFSPDELEKVKSGTLQITSEKKNQITQCMMPSGIPQGVPGAGGGSQRMIQPIIPNIPQGMMPGNIPTPPNPGMMPPFAQ